MAWDSSFWERGNLYGSTTGNYEDTPLGQIGAQDEPAGQYWRFLTDRGLTGTDRRSAFAQTLRSKFEAGYEAAKQTNPFLTREEYLGGFGRDFIDRQWNDLTPDQQGRDYGRFSPRIRIQGRG